MAGLSCEEATQKARQLGSEITDAIESSKHEVRKFLHLDADQAGADVLAAGVEQRFKKINTDYRLTARCTLMKERSQLRRQGDSVSVYLYLASASRHEAVELLEEVQALHAVDLPMEARTALACSLTPLEQQVRQLDDCIEEIERFRNSWGDAVQVLMLERRDFTSATGALCLRPVSLNILIKPSLSHVSILHDAWIGWDDTLARVDMEVDLATELFAACEAGGMEEVPFETLRISLAELVKMKHAVGVTTSDCRRALQDLKNMDESFRTPVELRSAMPYLEGRSVSIEQLSNARAEFERLGRTVSAVCKDLSILRQGTRDLIDKATRTRRVL
ncbi:hypothetical protein K466DRAFT_605076 [Polyporus arcularius HHB13444]|uniref:Uncharacterized protein n=1 Tax=Polyporus arcularius HHB13444 TaxID=1314778 RepID=A0A5C3NVE9_9APHY|nr:hypothetical protein K466DRAFT_605076 [Polyporus arcularius HHB13444]